MEIETKQMIIGLVVVNTLIFGARQGCKYIDHCRDATESRGYAVPERFEAKSVDLNKDGLPETVATYNGKAYFFKISTNGIPYFESIKGLESKVDK